MDKIIFINEMVEQYKLEWVVARITAVAGWPAMSQAKPTAILLSAYGRLLYGYSIMQSQWIVSIYMNGSNRYAVWYGLRSEWGKTKIYILP